MQAGCALGSPRTAAHNLCASPEHAARTACGGAASVGEVIADIRTTESSAKRAMLNTHFMIMAYRFSRTPAASLRAMMRKPLFDFVNPAGTGRRSLSGRRQTRLDNAQIGAGTLT